MVRITLRILPDDLYKNLMKSAENNRRSINSEVLRAIEFYLKNASKAHYQIELAEKPKEKKKVVT